jgi:FtsP/CotA-like multicopper oxidase with cupredoxin domain
MRVSVWRALFALCAVAAISQAVHAQHKALVCPTRPTAGSVVGDPKDLYSVHGELRVDLRYRSSVDAAGQTHYCYVSPDGSEAPTLRVKRGDLLILRLKNEEHPVADPPQHQHAAADGCTSAVMSATATNLHFHGMSVSPVCHQDDVLNTLVQPGDRPFEYRLRISPDEPPGLYWYHPHVHGVTGAQVLGGASGALIVEGIERATPTLAGLPERVFIIRDQELLNPDAPPPRTESVPAPMVLRDSEGDILNTGTGGGKPAKDLSINFVPVPYPDYEPAVIKLHPGERQLWRILNASAITYLDLQLLIGDQLQALGVVGVDGVPMNEGGMPEKSIQWQSHAQIPPAGRIELIVRGPPKEGQKASLVTRTVDTGPAGENDPTRPLVTVIADAGAPEPPVRLDAKPQPLSRPSAPWLGTVKPVRTRHLYFSEQPHDPKDPNSPTDFFITVEGQEPKLFDPSSVKADIVAKQGDVEDWIIENRTHELHAFHIHQLHFMLLEWNGIPLEDPFLRDTINVAYWDGKSPDYPSVRLRMDFRGANVTGTFLYHCHLLEHEDGGMMGLIRVEPRGTVPSH